MKKTTLLGLPIYDKPSEDKFKLNDWNIANENIERAFSSAINGKSLDIINTEVAEARGGEVNLKSKIGKIDTQLEQKTSKGNVSVADINKNLGKFDETYMSESLLNQITGNSPTSSTLSSRGVVTGNIDLKSVKPSNTSFFKLSTNLFNKNTIISNTSIDTTTGELISSDSTKTSDLIQAIANVPYSKSTTTSRIAFYDADMKLLTSKSGTTVEISPDKTAFIRVILTVETNANTFQVNQSNSLLSYEPYYELLDSNLISEIKGEAINNKSIDLNKLNFVVKSSNLIDKKKCKEGVGINSSTGIETVNLTVTTTDFIPFNENTVGILNLGNNRTCFYDVNKNFINSIVSSTFTSPSRTSFIRIVFTNESFVDAQLNVGSELLDYEEFYEAIDSQYIKMEVDKTKYEFAPEFPSYYYNSKDIPACDGSFPNGFNYLNSTSQDIYNKYDELMALYPEYIKREFLSNDGTGELPIYAYYFKPERSHYNTRYKQYPSIFLTSGVHGDGLEPAGDPLTSIFGLYYLMEDICKKWKSDEALSYLRWNIGFVIIPVVNPWGVNNKSRLNSNGVDINRNADSNWALETSEYKGTREFSEIETRNVRNVFNKFKKELITYIDYHTLGGVEFVPDNLLLRYVLGNNTDSYNITNHALGYISRKWFGKYVNSEINFYGKMGVYGKRPSLQSWVEDVNGVSSIAIEAFIATNGNRNKCSSLAMTMNTESLGNFILDAIRYFFKR